MLLATSDDLSRVRWSFFADAWTASDNATLPNPKRITQDEKPALFSYIPLRIRDLRMDLRMFLFECLLLMCVAAHGLMWYKGTCECLMSRSKEIFRKEHLFFCAATRRDDDDRKYRQETLH